MVSSRFKRYITGSALFILGILFVARFAGSALLKLYVETGVGDCKKVPILCVIPQEEVNNPQLNREFLSKLIPYDFPGMKISLPEGFSAVKEQVNKLYYKGSLRPSGEQVAYLLAKKPDFFLGLFPQVKKQGVADDYEFFRRTMTAELKNINNLTDVFFVIIKSIFIPNLGDASTIRIITVTLSDSRGFISFGSDKAGNYFDCNIFSRQGGFLKIYIKDTPAVLDLTKVYTILSTVEAN